MCEILGLSSQSEYEANDYLKTFSVTAANTLTAGDLAVFQETVLLSKRKA